MNITKSSKIFLGDTEIYRVEYQGTVIWKKQVVPPTPTIAYDYQVADSNTEFATEDNIPYAYSYNDNKWYCLNNNNQYELYGIYDENDNIDLITKYEGKLCISQGKEYQCTNNSWVYVGDVTGGVTRFTPTEGMSFPRKFQIKVSDYQSVGMFDFNVETMQGSIRVFLWAYSIGYVSGEYSYGWETQGTISTDNEWIYFDAGDGDEYTVDFMMRQPSCQLYSGGVTYPLEYDKNKFDDFGKYNGFYYASENDVRYKGKNIIYNINKTLYEWDGSQFVVSQKQYEDIYIKFICDSIDINPPITQSTILSGWGIDTLYDSDFNIYNDDISIVGKLSYGIIYKSSLGKDYNTLHFSECTLPSLSFVDTLEYAFRSCNNLTEIIIPDNIKYLNRDAISYCSSLTSLTIGSGVEYIDYLSIQGMPNVNVIISPSNSFYDTRDNSNAIIHTSSNTLVLGFNTSTIPDSVTSIGNRAFYGCTSLTSIAIPDSVTSIGYQTFYGCSGLTSIAIPDSVTSIGLEVFNECTSLTSVLIGSGITKLSSRLFLNCSKLNSITCNSTSEIDASAYRCLYGIAANGTLYTPNSSSDWTTFLSKLPSGWKQEKKES